MWAERHTLHSDIDLLVLTFQPLRSSLQEALINETYPLYLECGRQLSPLWRTVAFWENPPDDRVREIKARVEADMRLLPFSE